jgi:hypothetical protein
MSEKRPAIPDLMVPDPVPSFPPPPGPPRKLLPGYEPAKHPPPNESDKELGDR